MVEAVNRALREHFRPELLNRIDEVVIFHALDLERIKQIVRIHLAKVAQLVADRGLTLRATDRAVEALAREGYDPAFGARPLKRAVQRSVQNPLALELLEGAYPAGTTVTVDYADGGFQFEADRPRPDGAGDDGGAPGEAGKAAAKEHAAAGRGGKRRH